MARTLSKTGGRAASLRHIPPKLALCVGKPSGDAPKRWRWRELTSLARLESGHTPARKHPEYWEGDLPWISIKDAKANHGGMVQDTAEKTNALGIANSSARLLPKNTVCLSRTASVGYVIRSGSEMATSQDFVNWVCGDELSPEFLQYLLIAEGKDILRFASGAVHQTIYYPEAKGFWVCIPPIAEQEEIVEVLDKAFAAIDQAKGNIEQNIANAKELFQSKLNQIFSQKGEGWERRKLAEITSKIGSGATPKGGQAAYKTEGISLFRSLNVHDREFRVGKLAYIDFEQAEKLKNVIIQEGDVLLNITGASVARCCLAPAAHLPARVNQHVSIIRPEKELVDPSYLNKLLTSKFYKDQLLGIGEEGGSTRQAITKKQIQEFEIIVPSLSQQRKIAHEIDALSAETEQLEAHYQTKLASLDELKKSILQKAFAGELT